MMSVFVLVQPRYSGCFAFIPTVEPVLSGGRNDRNELRGALANAAAAAAAAAAAGLAIGDCETAASLVGGGLTGAAGL